MFRAAQASPVLQGQGLAGNVRVLHLGSPGGLQTNQASSQRMINLSSLARPAGTYSFIQYSKENYILFKAFA